MDLKNKKILITGAAQRMGKAIAQDLNKRGASILIHYNHSKGEAQALAKELHSAEILSANLENEKEVLKLAEDAQALGPVDFLINSASVYYPTPFEKIKLEDWNKIFNVNLKALFILSQKLGMAMKNQGQGSIINIADTAGFRPYRNYLPYCVSKGAVESFTKALALELSPEVRVNSISPGPIVPHPSENEKTIESVANRIPLKKWGGFEEIVKAVRFLCESDFTTGSNVIVDGGYYLV